MRSCSHLAPILARHHANPTTLVQGYALLATPVPAAAIAAVVSADPGDDALAKIQPETAGSG